MGVCDGPTTRRWGRWLATNDDVSHAAVAKTLGNGITAPTSCVTALYVALRFLDAAFDSMMRFIVACGGEVDTIGAMAGAIWGAYNGAQGLPDIALEGRESLTTLAARLFEHTTRT